ncbi:MULTISPECIES: 3-isopropylmalate dehydratase small subunit [Cedecea]|uniref:3-isopropylmalate dehydratase small subunit n=1 Tax=Cedecea davisae DSM 4568 TaxID=566551 RepID=S3IWM0_9ENTR|nr:MULTISPECIES: 3-isopropylmalate dehydratase small subunit [Cedecea]EPF16946.1 3-isopropylmalate dehydratase, small subunit [Cedecea davisae DSM 4568]QIX97829.1 3-isopropylmalate dehydratase small subunit [Cedecea sp. FDAARGOS_727]SUX27627.1 3-isopropylmalate dehydratase small subunit [Cedecea davisae]
MEPFNSVTGIAAPMMAANIDTDVIMPKQFLKGIDRSGLDKGVFFDRRFLADGKLNPAFILNRPEWRGATFLIVGPNFGCGSSREHAVWGLRQLGIRALIGTSFAGIFNDNCQRNGVLTLTLPAEDIARLAQAAGNPANNSITVDLAQQKIAMAGEYLSFAVDELKKHMLLEGHDAISYTLQYQQDIREFEQHYFATHPWLVA